MASKQKLTRGISKKRITDLISVARKMGLKRLKVGEVEFELGSVSQITKPVDKIKGEPDSVIEREPTEDEMLLMSTPFFEDIRTSRAEASKS